MLFRVDSDNGQKILCFVVPDSVGSIPSIRIASNGKELATLEANQVRNNFVATGRHETGQCGFIIDNKLVPKLAQYKDLEICEASSDLLIYRRSHHPFEKARVFRLETHLLPLWRLDDAFKDSFQYWYKGVERLGLETATQIFCLKNAKSSYISGRLLLRNFEHFLNQGMKAVALVRDPFHELAERIVVLRNIGSRADEVLGLRDAMNYSGLIDALNEYKELDDTFYKRFFRRTPFELLAMLSNPLTRQLTAAKADDMPVHTSVSTALHVLSGFEVLGLRSDASYFTQAVADLVGVPFDKVPKITEYPRIVEIGERLRDNSDAEMLLEKDLEVFQLLSQAFVSAGSPS